MSQLSPDICQLHFLVVDDYESMRILVYDQLKSLGVEKITLAESGQEGFEKIKASSVENVPVQIVLTDMMMENGTGIDLVKLIRSEDLTKHLPVVMITSKSEIPSVLEAIKAGVDSYIVKPWQVGDLVKKINEVKSKRTI